MQWHGLLLAVQERIPLNLPASLGLANHGRGIEAEHLKQNENREKKQAAASKQLLGRFGVGLKDALATLERRGVQVRLRSKHGEVTLARDDKHGFAAFRPSML